MGDSLYDTASTKGEQTKYRLAEAIKGLMDTTAVEMITVRQMGSGRTVHESLVRKFTYIQKEHTFLL